MSLDVNNYNFPATIPFSEQTQEVKEEFKRNLREISTLRVAEPQQITNQLSKIIPKNLELREIINVIFETRDKYDIPLFLDALPLINPLFELSPHDKIRKAILEDYRYTLTNSSLIAMFNELGLDNEDEIAACYDLAYKINHPNIYRESKTPVPPGDYTLNFLWVNLDPQDRIKDIAQNIFGDGLNPSENAACIKDPFELRTLEESEQSSDDDRLENWKQIKKTFTYRISKWADANPNAQINLWYDSALVTQRAQKNTFEMMTSISQSRGVNLKLRDIRHLPNIEGEIEHSLHPGTQVYYRVDMLKALIADYLISSPKESAKYCVVSDIDVAPMTPQRLFDQRCLDYLSSNGYVFNLSGFGDFENNFYIFNKEKEGLQRIHYESIIQETAHIIESYRQYPQNLFKHGYSLGPQFVYGRYRVFQSKMNESVDVKPRKAVKCPRSQFELRAFSKSDCQAEAFRFIGDSNIPYTRGGRNFHTEGEEGQIDALKNWKAEPLNVSL